MQLAMDLNIRRGTLLLFGWLLSLWIAFALGQSRVPTEEVLADSAFDQQGQAELRSAGSSKDGDTHTRGNSHTVARFIASTRNLRIDELARLLPEITEKMEIEDVHAAFARLAKLRPSAARRVAMLQLMDRFGQLQGAEALTHLEQMADLEPQFHKDMAHHAIKGWTSVDPSAAHAHLMGSPEFDKVALQAVWEGMAKSHDLEKTLAFIEELGPGSNQYSHPYEIWDIYMTLHELFRKNDRAVISWVESLPPGETRNRAFHSIVDQLARHDPEAAKEWIEKEADPSNIAVAHEELAESWARHDPEAAVAWAATLPEGTDGLRRIYERLFTRFIQYDFLDAANYLVAQEPSPQLDTAFEVYIDKVKSIDPASTMDWAIAITDEQRRWQAMQEVAAVWRGKDPAALQTYVDDLDLDEEQEAALLAKPK